MTSPYEPRSRRPARASLEPFAPQHDDAVAQINSRYVRLHREARAGHDARQMDLAELAELERRNELQRYELECQ